MKRKYFTASFKAKVAMEAIKNEATIAELAQKHGVHPSQINSWKKVLGDHAENLFSNKVNREASNQSEYVAELERKAGQLAMEIDFLKKGLARYHEQKGCK